MATDPGEAPSGGKVYVRRDGTRVTLTCTFQDAYEAITFQDTLLRGVERGRIVLGFRETGSETNDG